MRLRRATITLATALAAVFSVSAAAQAGMNNISVSPAMGPRTPSIPDVKARPVTIDANIHLHCYPTRERNELGVWVHRTRCN